MIPNVERMIRVDRPPVDRIVAIDEASALNLLSTKIVAGLAERDELARQEGVDIAFMRNNVVNLGRRASPPSLFAPRT